MAYFKQLMQYQWTWSWEEMFVVSSPKTFESVSTHLGCGRTHVKKAICTARYSWPAWNPVTPHGENYQNKARMTETSCILNDIMIMTTNYYPLVGKNIFHLKSRIQKKKAK